MVVGGVGRARPRQQLHLASHSELKILATKAKLDAAEVQFTPLLSQLTAYCYLS